MVLTAKENRMSFSDTNHDAEPAAIAEPSRKSDAQHPSAAQLQQPADEGQGTGDTQQPVAWAVFEADGNCVGTYSSQADARIVMEELAYDGMVYEPLYRQPGAMLTHAERTVLEICAAHWKTAPASKVLRVLLERLG